MSSDRPLGAWVKPADTKCSNCEGKLTFFYRFKKFGVHELEVCENCGKVLVDGDEAAELVDE